MDTLISKSIQRWFWAAHCGLELNLLFAFRKPLKLFLLIGEELINTELEQKLQAECIKPGLSSSLKDKRAPQINLLAQFGGESAFNQFQHVKKLQTSAYMLKHLENGLMMFTTEMNCTITVSLIYIKNYSRQMHLHKIYLFILIYCNLHNLSMPTAICRQPLGK